MESRHPLHYLMLQKNSQSNFYLEINQVVLILKLVFADSWKATHCSFGNVSPLSVAAQICMSNTITLSVRACNGVRTTSHSKQVVKGCAYTLSAIHL